MDTQPPLTRHQRRELERQQRRQGEQRQGRNRQVRPVVGFLVLVAAIVGAVYGLIKLGGPAPTKVDLSPFFKGTLTSSQGRDHIAVGASHAPYATNPPTSGPHYEDTIPLGVYDEPQTDENLVHNLEHGHVWVSYNCSDGCPDLVTQLKTVVERYQLYILEPRKDNPQKICLAAWEYLDCFEEFDEQRIQAFFQQRENQGPEKLPPSAHKRK